MATILKRKGKCQVQIRRDGHSLSKTFHLKATAEEWARDANPVAKWARTEDCLIGEPSVGVEAGARRTPVRTCFNAGRTSDAE